MGNQIDCPCRQWEEIHGFELPSEYDRFVNWIEGVVRVGDVHEVGVEDHYDGSYLFKERWFHCDECGRNWRLVKHDFPFKGLFAVVDGNTGESKRFKE